MRLKRLLLLLPLLLVPLEAPAIAQNIQVGMPIKISRLPACTYQKAGVGYYVYDGASTSDCTTGGGSTPVLCVCDGSAPWLASSTVPTGISRTGQILIAAAGAGNDVTTTAADDEIHTITDDVTFACQDFLPTATATSVLVAPTQTFTATTSATFTTPLFDVSGVYERKVTNVTAADDGAGTKPAIAIPITTDFATCTCNDATGCTATIAEPTPTSGYGRSLTVVSIGSGNCEFADSAGVLEIGTTVVLEPTSAMTFAYLNSSWYNTSYKDNVP